MKESKDNIITIVFVFISIIILLLLVLFFYNSMDKENKNISRATEFKTNYDSDNIENSFTNKSSIDSPKIHMSQYYIDSSYGKVAEVYNSMLDELNNKKNIIKIYKGDSNNEGYKKELDIINKVSLYTKGKDYIYKKYENGKVYIETYNSKEEYKEGIESNTYLSIDDFFEDALKIKFYDEYCVSQSCEENINFDNHKCYRITANYSSGNGAMDGKECFYIDMNTKELVAITFETPLTNNVTYTYYYEYSNDEIRMPGW